MSADLAGGGARAGHILIPFHDFNRGGTERVALTLARHWLDAGRRVTVLCGSRSGGTVDQVDPRADIVELDPELRRSPLSRLKLGAAMAGRLPALAPDAVFVPGNFHYVVIPSFRRALPAAALVAKVSNPLLPDLPWPLGPAARAAMGALTQGLDALVYMAPELAEAGRQHLPHLPAAIIAEPNLPAGYAAPARRGPDDPPIILAIGRLEPQKNFALALAAFAKLRRQTAVRLVILGEGAERPRLEALARRLGIAEDVTMPGYTADVQAHLAGASAMLVSSRYEGYPAVVVEALAADVPVVATACTPCLASLIDRPERGEIVPSARPADLAAGLVRTLAQPFATGGSRAAAVAHHDAAASARAYLELFDGIVARKAGQTG